MKKIILPLTILVSLASCQTQEDKVVEYAKSQMKDPKSFKLVKVEENKDTVRLSLVYLNAVLSLKEESVDYNKQALESYENAMMFSTPYYVMKYKNEGDEYTKTSTELWNRADSLYSVADKLEGTPKDTIVCIDWYVSGYANNSFGQRVLGKYTIHTYPNGKMDMGETK